MTATGSPMTGTIRGLQKGTTVTSLNVRCLRVGWFAAR